MLSSFVENAISMNGWLYICTVGDTMSKQDDVSGGEFQCLAKQAKVYKSCIKWSFTRSEIAERIQNKLKT